MSTKFATCFLALLYTTSVWAASAAVTFSKLDVPLLPGTNAIAYPTILSKDDDEIVSISSDCCAAVEFHRHEMHGDVMRMRRVETLPLVGGAPLVFADHGLHVMLIGLKKPLTAGEAINVSFHFAHAPAQTVAFTVNAQPLHATPDSPKDH